MDIKDSVKLIESYLDLDRKPVGIKFFFDKVKFDNFEKICCYSYTGLMNAPWQSAKPGGERTIKLYNDYLQYLKKSPRVSNF